jgi:hypothetical protein
LGAVIFPQLPRKNGILHSRPHLAAYAAEEEKRKNSKKRRQKRVRFWECTGLPNWTNENIFTLGRMSIFLAFKLLKSPQHDIYLRFS